MGGVRGEQRWDRVGKRDRVSVTFDGVVQRLQGFKSDTTKFRSWPIWWQFLILILICEVNIVRFALPDQRKHRICKVASTDNVHAVGTR